MNMKQFVKNKGEKPLDNIVSDGGFTGIFRSIGAVGDSLASGEFERLEATGKSYHDCFDFSWGQYLARMAGTTVINMSRGGMTAIEFCESFGNRHGYFAEDIACGAYIFALGENDIHGRKQKVGTVDDISKGNPSEHPDTFAGWYGELVLRFKLVSPDAKFFFVTMPRYGGNDEHEREAEEANNLIRSLADYFTNSYVIDLWNYAPVYDEEFKKNFFLEGHMNPTGYILTAKMFASYIDYIIRNNPEDFAKAGFIKAQYKTTNL